jgi:hypothetical protein
LKNPESLSGQIASEEKHGGGNADQPPKEEWQKEREFCCAPEWRARN